MLVEKIKDLFKTYIYRPHVHDYKFDMNIDNPIEVMGLKSRSVKTIYKCSGCSRVIQVSESNAR